MAKMVKCPTCKKENTREVAVLITQGSKNYYYCPECAEQYFKDDNKECTVCGGKHHLSKMIDVNNDLMCKPCYNQYKKNIEKQFKTKKCTGCGEYRLEAEGTQFSNRKWYCASCAPKRQEQIELHKAINDFLLVEQGEHYSPTLLNAQIKKFKEEYGMTLSGIYKTLKFIVDIKEKPLEREGVGLVPYYYNEARNFYKHKSEITDHALKTPKELWVIEETVRTVVEEHKPRLKRPVLSMEDVEID